MAVSSRQDTPYHHGRLRAALVDATIALIQEAGCANASVREAARRAGVSSGAPFRHFPSRAALMTAVADQVSIRLRADIDAAVARAAQDDPLAKFGALMLALVRWMARNPGLFEVLADRRGLDIAASSGLKRDIARTQARAIDLLSQAGAQGFLRSDDLFNQVLAARALAMGLGRLRIDGGLAEWGVDGEAAEPVMIGAMSHFLRSLAVSPDRHSFGPAS